jgi:hypothetical protein
LGRVQLTDHRSTATIYIGKAPHFEEAICDVGIFEQTAEVPVAKICGARLLGSLESLFVFNLVE